jgi:hypothetical protein
MARSGKISYVYNDGEGYFINLDPIHQTKHKETFFLSDNMVITEI